MLIKKLNDQHGIKIKVIRCDNAGENKKMEEACDRLGLKMKVTMRECKGCGLGKMRQKNVSKEQVPRAKNIGERMFVDISSIKHKRAGGAKFWALFMDDCSGFLINRFLREKSDLARQEIGRASCRERV